MDREAVIACEEGDAKLNANEPDLIIVFINYDAILNEVISCPDNRIGRKGD